MKIQLEYGHRKGDKGLPLSKSHSGPNISTHGTFMETECCGESVYICNILQVRHVPIYPLSTLLN